jgi:hypothetical protein
MINTKAFLFTISVFLVAADLLAPAPYEIALNLAEKQCAGYWSGDEFVTYVLPDGWKSYEFEYSEDFVVAETDIGTCRVAKNQVVAFDYEEPCCSQLGYVFVSENIGVRRFTSFNLTSQAEMEEYANQGQQAAATGSYILAFTGFIVLLLLVVLLMKEIKKV